MSNKQGFLSALMSWLRGGDATPQHVEVVEPEREASSAYQVVAFDEDLLEKARLHWHIGDWDSITSIDREALQHHPDRAKLALLVAAALQQTDQAAAAAQYARLAREWGCSKKLIAQILIAGVHNTLARAAAALGDQAKSNAHFRLAVSSGTPGLDSALLARTRAANELGRMEEPAIRERLSGADGSAQRVLHTGTE